jgi:NifU-like protein involved in Fe-S cluster formation
MLSKFKGIPLFCKALAQEFAFSYHANVLDHYEKPRNVGSMDKSAKNIGTGLVGAPACGDVMKLQIKVGSDGHTIEDAVFKVQLKT